MNDPWFEAFELTTGEGPSASFRERLTRRALPASEPATEIRVIGVAEPVPEPTPTDRRRPAAAAALLLAGGLALGLLLLDRGPVAVSTAGDGGDDPAVLDAPADAPTEADAVRVATADELAIPSAIYDAVNREDLPAYEAAIGEASDISMTNARVILAEMYWDLRIEIVAPCRRLDNGGSIWFVECDLEVSDTFHSRVGNRGPRTDRFAFDADGNLLQWTRGDADDPEGHYGPLNEAFNRWLEETHPDLHEVVRPIWVTHLPGTRAEPPPPEAMEDVTELVDEFFADSDEWEPVDG